MIDKDDNKIGKVLIVGAECNSNNYVHFKSQFKEDKLFTITNTDNVSITKMGATNIDVTFKPMYITFTDTLIERIDKVDDDLVREPKYFKPHWDKLDNTPKKNRLQSNRKKSKRKCKRK